MVMAAQIFLEALAVKIPASLKQVKEDLTVLLGQRIF
jgi:hypothetical protein